MKKSVYGLSLAGCIAATCAIVVLNAAFSRHGFDNFDLSPMIDAGWRVFSGQVPGRDFPVTFPPSHYLLTAALFRIFGVTWPALTFGGVSLFALITFLGLRLSALARKTHDGPTATWIAITFTAAQAIFLLPYSTLWHATLAMDFAMYAVCAAFLLTGRPAHRPETITHLTLALALLVLSKPNTAWPAILLCVAVATLSGLPKRVVAALCAAALLLASLALNFAHTNLLAMLTSYMGLTGRLLPIGFLYAIAYYLNARIALANLLVYAILAPVLTAATVSLWRTRGNMRQPAKPLGLGCILIALLAMGTNIQFKLSDTPLLLLGIVFLTHGTDEASVTMRRRLAITLCALTLTAAYFGRTRLAYQASGEWTAEGCTQTSFRDSFFGPMQTCRAMPHALSEIDATLTQNPDARIFFGSGLEFAYAAHHMPSPQGLPNWWHPGTSYPLSHAGEIADAWQRQHFDLVILGPNEYRSQMPASIGQQIDAGYERTGVTTEIHVYRRKP